MFERTDSGSFPILNYVDHLTGAGADDGVGEPVVANVLGYLYGEQDGEVNATLAAEGIQAVDGSAAANVDLVVSGRIATSRGQTVDVPESNTYTLGQVKSKGADGNDLSTGYAGIGTQASSEWTFHESAENSAQLTFHGHVVIAGSNESFVSGDGDVHTQVGTTFALINDNWGLTADYYEPYWHWSRYLPGGTIISGTSFGAVNLHLHIEIPIDDDQIISFFLGGTSTIDAENLYPHDNAWLATNFVGTTAAAWGYVTESGEDFDDGDFNYDGIVNIDDFEIWKERLPQADADEDGDVDDDDLEYWINNTDEIVVSTESDVVDSDYTIGNLSLREAIAIAGDTNHPGHDSIVFAPWVEEIILENGPLAIYSGNPVTIDGLGTDRLTINADGASAVFSTAGSTVTISDLSLTGATSVAITAGSSASVTLDSIEVYGNGTGITAGYGSQLTISNSTIAENNGVGVSVVSSATADIYNSTISSNETVGPVAGVSVSGATATLTNVTVTNNRADKNKITGASTATGGVFVGIGGTVTLHNSIVVGNFAGAVSNSVAADLKRESYYYYAGTFGSTSSYNLVGTVSGGGFPTGNNNQLGVSVANVGLAALADNGGPTRTHALLETSVAIDAGDNAKAIALALEYDQRGEAFRRIYDGDGDDDWTVDAGAFEYGADEFFGWLGNWATSPDLD